MALKISSIGWPTVERLSSGRLLNALAEPSTKIKISNQSNVPICFYKKYLNFQDLINRI